MYKTLLFIITFCITFFSNAQVITTSNTLTPQQLVNNILIGSGVTVSNVTFNGSAVSAQSIQTTALSFTATGFPFNSGVYLRTSTGNMITDADLSAISTNTITNGAILEFDFVPAGDSLVFNYMFASAEYPTYVCSGFNDVFGFFISGPGISGPFTNGAENIALVPGTNVPVAINTVNSGTAGAAGTASTCAAQDPNWQSNSVYYTTLYANYSGEGYNGGTVSLPALAQLQCGQTYHIKLAVSNVGDTALDSGVYLEGGSFNSDAIEVAIATVSGDTTVVEGCTTADLMFIRPQSQLSDTLIINYDIGGTATMIDDYDTLSNPVTFFPGDDTVSITINPLADGISDNNESIIITVTTVNQCGDTITSTGTLWIVDSVNINISAIDPVVGCENDSVMVVASASGGTAPYTYSWSNGQVGDTSYLSTVTGVTSGDSIYVLTVTDACGYTNTDTVTVTLNQTLAIDTIGSTPTSTCINNGSVGVSVIGATGAPNYSWNGPGVSNPNSSLNQVWAGLDTGWYYVTITDNVCSLYDSAYVDSYIPAAPTVNGLDTTIYCETDSIDVTCLVNGGTAPYSYAWSTGDTTQVISVPGNPDGSSTEYIIIVTDQCGLTNQDTVTVIVNVTINIDSITSTATSSCLNDGSVYATSAGTFGTVSYDWSGPGTVNPDTYNGQTWQGLSSGWYYLVITDDYCSDSASVFVDMNNPPQAALIASPDYGCNPLGVTFINNSSNTNSYFWDFGNGTSINASDESSQSQIYTTNSTAMLIAYAGPCSDTAYANISIIECGCTDPNAENYNPAAVEDDGSCTYPIPTVVAPNVFTPNQDGDNDLFYLETTNTIDLEFVILNRWGNTMYEEHSNPSLGLISGWNGLTPSGAQADDGTYFYTYKATGINGDIVEGHGFLQVVNAK